MHPGTCSRADLATFRLTARTHDPTSIRRTSILEIVESIPGRNRALPPAIRTLTYPISIWITRSEDGLAAPADNDDGDGRAPHDDRTRPSAVATQDTAKAVAGAASDAAPMGPKVPTMDERMAWLSPTRDLQPTPP